MTAPVTLCIINYNGERYLERTLAAARRSASAFAEILVVDDAKFSSAMIGRTLSQAGYQDLRFASSASEALRLLEEKPANVILADWLMPEIDGLELTARVRQLDEMTDHYSYIILLTGKEGENVLGEAFDRGVDDFISKAAMSDGRAAGSGTAAGSDMVAGSGSATGSATGSGSAAGAGSGTGSGSAAGAGSGTGSGSAAGSGSSAGPTIIQLPTDVSAPEVNASAFPTAVRLVAMFLVPVAFINFVPVVVVSGHMSWWWLAGVPAAVIGSVLLAVGVYRLGLRAYDSAGH